MTVPYKGVTGLRSYQTWNTDASNFWLENFVDVTQYLNSSNWTSDTFLRLYHAADGSYRLIGQVTYVPAGPTAGVVSIVAFPTSLVTIGNTLNPTRVPVTQLTVALGIVLASAIQDVSGNSIDLDQDAAASLSAGDKIDVDVPLYVSS